MKATDTTDTTDTTDVVVVTYESERWIAACLDSLVGQSGIGRIVVVDNGSTDATASVVHRYADRNVALRALGVNQGFGSAANRGVAATASAAVLIVNPDLIAEVGVVTRLRSALDVAPGIAVVGPTVTDLSGATYPSARSFPSLTDAAGHAFLGLFWKANPWSAQYLSPTQVQWISGTAMLVRRSAFEAVGGFDESFFMYVEDVDLCWRLAGAGWTVALESAAVVRHGVGGSSGRAPYRMIVAHHRSLWRFARRSATPVQRLALPLVAVALVGRAAIVSCRYRRNGQAPAARATNLYSP